MTKYTYETKENLPNLLINIDFKTGVMVEGEEYSHIKYVCDLKKTYTNWEVGRTEPSIFEIFNILITTDATANDLEEYSHIKYVCDLKNNDCRAAFYSEKCAKELYPMSVEQLESAILAPQ